MKILDDEICNCIVYHTMKVNGEMGRININR